MTTYMPRVLRDEARKWIEGAPSVPGPYESSIYLQKRFMRLPNPANENERLAAIKVWIPHPKTVTWYPIAKVYNCVTHALGTFDPIERDGYWIDMEDSSVWRTMGNADLSLRTKEFGGEFPETIKKNDLIFIWDKRTVVGPQKEEDEAGHEAGEDLSRIPDDLPWHKALHAAVVVKAVFNEGQPRRLDESKTIVSTKNGELPVRTAQTLQEMFKQNPKFRNAGGDDQEFWSVHRLLPCTHRFNDPFAEVVEKESEDGVWTTKRLLAAEDETPDGSDEEVSSGLEEQE